MASNSRAIGEAAINERFFVNIRLVQHLTSSKRATLHYALRLLSCWSTIPSRDAGSGRFFDMLKLELDSLWQLRQIFTIERVVWAVRGRL